MTRTKGVRDVCIIGSVFNRLTTISDVFQKECNNRLKAFVTVKCICGVIKDCNYNQVKYGKIQSCGCLRKEVVSLGRHGEKHNLSYHPLYVVHQDMKARCYNNNAPNYKNYGGRGIIICKEWLLNFKVFFDWAILNGWEAGLELNRVDNDGNYEPGNCNFVPTSINSRNKRSNVLTEEKVIDIRRIYNSEKITLTELSKMYNVSLSSIHHVVKNISWKF